MYAAHFATSLGCKAFAPRVSVVALLVAGLAPDLLFAALMRSGIERIEAPLGAPFAQWQIIAPYSHGAIAAVTATLLLAYGLRLARSGTPVGTWISALAGAVLLHLLGDWIVEPSGMRLLASSATVTGLQLWRSSPMAAMLLEVAVVVGGTLVFLRKAERMSLTMKLVMMATLALLTWQSTFGQHTAVFTTNSVDLALPYLGKLARDLLWVGIFATSAATKPMVPAVTLPR